MQQEESYAKPDSCVQQEEQLSVGPNHSEGCPVLQERIHEFYRLLVDALYDPVVQEGESEGDSSATQEFGRRQRIPDDMSDVDCR